MTAKKLEMNSNTMHLDVDGDGVVSDEEMMREERMIELADKRSDMENEDKKQDAQRNMAWFALSGMLLYPFAVVIAVWLGLDQAGSILGDMTQSILYLSQRLLPHSTARNHLSKEVNNVRIYRSSTSTCKE